MKRQLVRPLTGYRYVTPPTFGGGGGTFIDPIDDMPWTNVWYATDLNEGGAPPSNGGPVGDGTGGTTWKDLIGTVNLTTFTLVGNMPTYRSADSNMNGKPSVEFDGTDDFLGGTYPSTYTDPVDLILVFKLRSVAGFVCMVDVGAGTPRTGFYTNFGTGWWMYDGGGSITTTETLTTTVHTARLHYDASTSGNVSFMQIDGAKTFGNMTNQGTTGILLGSFQGGTNFSAITLGIIGVVDGSVTDAQYNDFRLWAQDYYGAV